MAMLLALGAWLWGWVGGWVLWIWGVAAIGLDGFLKSCGLVFLGERFVKWWRGEL